MAENSKPAPKKGRPKRKRAALTPNDAVQLLESAMNYCSEAGLDVKFTANQEILTIVVSGDAGAVSAFAERQKKAKKPASKRAKLT